MRYAVLLLLLCHSLLHAKNFDDVEALVQSNPRRAYEYALVQLNSTSLAPRDRAHWHAIASESAYALALNLDALNHATDGLQSVRAVTDEDLRMRLIIARAAALDIGGQSDQSVKLLNEVLVQLEAHPNEQRLLDALIARGEAYTTLSRTAEALADLRRAYTIAPQQSLFKERADVASALGNLYSDMQQRDDATYFYQEAIARHRESNNHFKLSVETYSLANVRLAQKQFDSAKALMQESLEHSQKIDDFQGVAFARFGLAEIAREKGLYADSYNDYLFAMRWFRDATDKPSLIMCLRGLALAKLARGEKKAALADIKEADQLAASISDKRLLMRTNQTYADILKQSGDFAGAYDRLQLYHQLYEELIQEGTSLTTAELRVKFESERKQQENMLLQKENALKAAELQQQQARNNVYLLASSLLLVVIGFLMLFAYKQKQTRLKLMLLAETDTLTALYNRRRVLELAEVEFERSRRYGVEFCVAILDLDHFKYINDHYGHDCGDTVLKTFAQICKRTLRQTDIVGRWGGEEFVALLPHTHVSTAVTTLDRLRVRLAEYPIPYQGQELHVTVSVGVAQLQGDADFNVLLNRADQALYSAKSQGRNGVRASIITREQAQQIEQEQSHKFEVL